MSEVYAQVVEIESIVPHPNADRLEVAHILGATTVVPKGKFEQGDIAFYLPPDLLIADEIAEQIGIQKYLKHAYYPGSLGSSQCRVAATRLRGVPSYGALIAVEDFAPTSSGLLDVGREVNFLFQAVKYQPPVKEAPRNARPVHPDLAGFHKYTDIERYQKYPNLIPEGTFVRITEKIHGRNCRVGVFKVDGEWQFVAGSHNVILKQPEGDAFCPYWEPLKNAAILEMLNYLCDERHNVIVFGEVYGEGMQDMDYGVARGEVGFRVFDISIDGQYRDFDDVCYWCRMFGVQVVPILYRGSMIHELVLQLTDGETTVGDPRSKFKGREGIVITPMHESVTDNGKRMILKSISVDYLDRKGAKDTGEFD